VDRSPLNRTRNRLDEQHRPRVAVALPLKAPLVVSGRDDAAAVVARNPDTGGRAEWSRADSERRDTKWWPRAAEAAPGRAAHPGQQRGHLPGQHHPDPRGETFDRSSGTAAPFPPDPGRRPRHADAGGADPTSARSPARRPDQLVYSATKGALETLTRASAEEFGPRGIRVNAISPGVIRTPDLPPDRELPGETLMHGTPAGRAGHPDAIAAAAVYLASDEAAFVHGTVLDVDGGRVAVAVSA
jgi:NAD(P)-dependent dehydrogenase (short-subunit alcohol dehydrogenase family)